MHCDGTEQRLADCISDDKKCLNPGAGVQCPVYDAASEMTEAQSHSDSTFKYSGFFTETLLLVYFINVVVHLLGN